MDVTLRPDADTFASPGSPHAEEAAITITHFGQINLMRSGPRRTDASEELAN